MSTATDTAKPAVDPFAIPDVLTVEPATGLNPEKPVHPTIVKVVTDNVDAGPRKVTLATEELAAEFDKQVKAYARRVGHGVRSKIHGSVVHFNIRSAHAEGDAPAEDDAASDDAGE